MDVCTGAGHPWAVWNFCSGTWSTTTFSSSFSSSFFVLGVVPFIFHLPSFIHSFILFSSFLFVIFSVFLIHVFTEAPQTGAGGLSFGLSGGSGLNRQSLDSFHRCCPYSLPWQELVTPTQYTSVSLKVCVVSCRVKGVNVD